MISIAWMQSKILWEIQGVSLPVNNTQKEGGLGESIPPLH